MTIERIPKLKSIDFVWEVGSSVGRRVGRRVGGHGELWEDRFEELKDYRKKYGNCLVPQNYQHNKKLGKWVSKQRVYYKQFQKGENSFMTKERISKLKSIGFVWGVGQGGDGLPNDELWKRRFEELKDYRKKYGNCLVPKRYQHNKQLGTWVHHQRTQYKKFQKGENSHMTKERISKLDYIKFVWEVVNGGDGLSNDELWDNRFEELKDYRKKYGNCNVPYNYQHSIQLGNWVNAQRRQYKKLQKGEKSPITNERISKLKSIGFVWEVGKGKGIKSATVVEAQNDSHKRQTQEATKGRGRKRKEITRNSLQLTNNSKRQKAGPEPSSSSSQESSLNKQKKEEKKGRKKSPTTSQKRSNPTPDAAPSSSEMQMPIPDSAPSSRPTTSQRRSNPTPDAPPSSSEIQTPIPDAPPSSSTSWNQQRSNPSSNAAAASTKYINSRIAKVFFVEGSNNASSEEKKTDIFFGTVDRLRLTHNDTIPLWHVQYDDGDEEEFFGDELVKVLKFYKRNRDNDPRVIAHTKKVKAETF